MTVTITLPAATEEKLRAEAAAVGKDIGTVILEAVEARLSLGRLNLREILAPVHEDFHRSGMTEAELDAFLTETLDEVRAEREIPSDSAA